MNVAASGQHSQLVLNRNSSIHKHILEERVVGVLLCSLRHLHGQLADSRQDHRDWSRYGLVEQVLEVSVT